MKVFSATIALMLLAKGSAFSPSAQSKTSTSLNVVSWLEVMICSMKESS